MKLLLNADNLTSAVRRHFEISGMINSKINLRRSGALASVEINDRKYGESARYFNHLKIIVVEAQRKLHDELQMDDDCLVAIGQLGVIS